MKKAVFILLAVFLFIFILQNNQSNDKMVFWTLQLSGFENYINNIIKNSAQKNITWVDVPYTEGEKRTLASILTDNPPDLINITPDFSILLAQKKALYEISGEKLKEYNLTEALSYNGKYYGIPFYATSSVTLFNKSLMPNLKVLPKTYDEILEIKPPKGVYITMISLSENDTLLKILNKYNINNPSKINSSESIKFFKKIKYAFDNKYIPIESVTQTHRDALEKYMSGQLVFLVTGANFINMIKENAPQIYENTVVLPQLTGTTGKYDFSLMNFVIPLRANHKEEALNFALYFTNCANQTEFSKLTSVLPVNKKSLEDDFFTKSNDNNLQEQARIISAKQLENMQTPMKNTKHKKDLNLLASQAVQEILINNKDIKTILDNFSKEWKKLED